MFDPRSGFDVAFEDLKINFGGLVDHVSIDGAFRYVEGKWECSDIHWIEIVDAIGRRYFTGNFDGILSTRTEEEKSQHDAIKDIINYDYRCEVSAAIESDLAKPQERSGHSP